MKLAGFRLVVVAVFGGNYAQLDQKPARSVSSEFEDEGNVKRGDRGDFYSSACLDSQKEILAFWRGRRVPTAFLSVLHRDISLLDSFSFIHAISRCT